MLEDDAERLQRFASVLANSYRTLDFRHWRTAPAFIAGFQAATHPPNLICLDHDLFVEHAGDPDPGDGRDVARFLATQTPSCHIVVHSSNMLASDSMFFTLTDAGWKVEKVVPIGEDWIESDWLEAVRRRLRP